MKGSGSQRSKNLVNRLQKESPGLRAEDAFFVPLWFSQQKAWLQDPLNSDTAAYNYPLLLSIRGDLSEDALRSSLQGVVQRHEVLHSVFHIDDGELVQIVAPKGEFALPVTDLSGLPESARNPRVEQLAIEEVMHPFDLARGPLLRGQLFRLAPNDHVLQLTTHHLVYDDWSTGVLIHELSRFYQGFAVGAAPREESPSYQYGDFVRWLEERFHGVVLESELTFWKQQLDGSNGFQHLPMDHARPTSSTHRGARETMELPTAMANSLIAMSRQERVSLFMVLVAGFQCLLHRYSGDEEIGIASCTANRPLMEVEGLIGRFGNGMLLRTSFAGKPTFRELLNRVREVALRAYSHQDLPFGMVTGEIAEKSGAPNHSLFQTMFILQNAPKEAWQLPGLTVNWLPLLTGIAKHDLIVWLKSEPALEVTLEYNTDVFTSATMKRALDDYRSILTAVAKDPGALVHNIPILPATAFTT